jgi:hypothetical protein
VTTTTLARIPEALPIVAEPWEWEKLLDETVHYPRYNGRYFAYEETIYGDVVVVGNDREVLRHRPLDDQRWILQDIELGDHWLAIASIVGPFGTSLSRLTVYDLETGQSVVDEFWTSADGDIGSPRISVSGSYMALVDPLPTATCLDVVDLRNGTTFDTICADDRITGVELEGMSVAFSTETEACRSAMTGSLFDQDHDLVERSNRTCWSNSPASGGHLAAWFESPPEEVGIDTMIGVSADNTLVGLGKGDNGTAEICWNHAVWLSGSNDVRSWDGSGEIRTIYENGDTPAYELGCVGPWVTFQTSDGVYTTNMLTQSGAAACDAGVTATHHQTVDLAASLTTWVHDRFDDLPEELEVSVAEVVGLDGWWVGHGEFSSHLEGAIFAWSPDSDISVAWSGNADSEYDVRSYMLDANPEVPAALLGCVDVSGYH